MADAITSIRLEPKWLTGDQDQRRDLEEVKRAPDNNSPTANVYPIREMSAHAFATTTGTCEGVGVGRYYRRSRISHTTGLAELHL